MIDSNYNNNTSDLIALIALDEQNMPSSDAGSDSEEDTIKELKVCKWITDYEDVSVSTKKSWKIFMPRRFSWKTFFD